MLKRREEDQKKASVEAIKKDLTFTELLMYGSK